MDDQCCGLTSRNQQCKKRSTGLTFCLKVGVPTCRYHKNKNWIYQWATFHNYNLPPVIEKYLENCYWIQMLNPETNPKTCVMMTSHAWPTTDTSQFFNSLFLKTSQRSECPVCMEDDNLYPLARCGHGFCMNCVTKWVREIPTCPLCRKNVFKL